MPSDVSSFFRSGPIAPGTSRPQDLLRSFADEVERITQKLVAEARAAADGLDKDDSSEVRANEIIDLLGHQLNAIAHREGAYYFGTVDGTGSDFGFLVDL